MVNSQTYEILGWSQSATIARWRFKTSDSTGIRQQESNGTIADLSFPHRVVAASCPGALTPTDANIPLHRPSIRYIEHIMNNMSQHSQQAATDLARRLDGIFVSIALAVAAQFRLLGPWTAPIWARLNRANRRLQALLAHLAAGRLPRPHVPRPRHPSTPDPMTAAPLPPLPRAQAWLVRMIGYRAAGYGAQLQTLLHDPATLAVLAAAPSAGRTLRPFCRLLGVTLPAVLQLPPRAPRQPRSRPAQPRPKPPVIPPWGLAPPEPEPPPRPFGTDTAGFEFDFKPA